MVGSDRVRRARVGPLTEKKSGMADHCKSGGDLGPAVASEPDTRVYPHGYRDTSLNDRMGHEDIDQVIT